ncbi:hypothetical protein B0T19DRAFT_31309 [Cercophora scortea]|uniref:Uncharacterized protein n=1 Tax=Cercophora scortea TaxID=314031 RepID=A0AAE0J3Y1_9PEZI|nr:hypothetical protein B0T19DRAFT_31309 [Cercophora scortea]
MIDGRGRTSGKRNLPCLKSCAEVFLVCIPYFSCCHCPSRKQFCRPVLDFFFFMRRPPGRVSLLGRWDQSTGTTQAAAAATRPVGCCGPVRCVLLHGWRLEVGGWKLEVGSWRLEVGGWRLEVGGARHLPACFEAMKTFPTTTSWRVSRRGSKVLWCCAVLRIGNWERRCDDRDLSRRLQASALQLLFACLALAHLILE